MFHNFLGPKRTGKLFAHSFPLSHTSQLLILSLHGNAEVSRGRQIFLSFGFFLPENLRMFITHVTNNCINTRFLPFRRCPAGWEMRRPSARLHNLPQCVLERRQTGCFIPNLWIEKLRQGSEGIHFSSAEVLVCKQAI